MSQSKQPPFKRGEWVRFGTPNKPLFGCVRRCRWMCAFGDEFWGVFLVGREYAERCECETATARELRAESKRLAKRAAELSAAADAVEAKKKQNSP